jgi:hypothetical protein
MFAAESFYTCLEMAIWDDVYTRWINMLRKAA